MGHLCPYIFCVCGIQNNPSLDKVMDKSSDSIQLRSKNFPSSDDVPSTTPVSSSIPSIGIVSPGFLVPF